MKGIGDWFYAFLAMLFFAGFFIVGFIPLHSIIRIRKNGIKAKATITNVKQMKKAGGRSMGEYSAIIKFKTKNGRSISGSYFSSGDYLTLFQQSPEIEVDIIYSSDNPNKFYLPKDKSDIGINIIFAAVGLVGIFAIIWIFA